MAASGAMAPNTLLERTNALTGRGIASFLLAVVDQEKIDKAKAAAAWQDLSEAIAILTPFARRPSPDARPDELHRLYGQTIAWRSVLCAQILSENIKADCSKPGPETERYLEGIKPALAKMHDALLPSPDQPEACRYKTELLRQPKYPSGAIANLKVGSLVYFIQTNAGGAVENVELAGVVGKDFAESRNFTGKDIRRSVLPDSPANCTPVAENFLTVQFVLPKY